MEDYKYMTIVEWSRNYIISHKLKPKDRFLTEKELCEIHGVSRQTVRQALMCLENENVISRAELIDKLILAKGHPDSERKAERIGKKRCEDADDKGVTDFGPAGL